MSYHNYMHTSSSTAPCTLDFDSIKKAIKTLNLDEENIFKCYKYTKSEKEKKRVNVKIPTVLFDPEDLVL